MDSQREYSPEVFSVSEMMDELIQIKCDHPRRIIQHNEEDKRPMVPASCAKCCDCVRTMANLFLQTCPHGWNEVRHPMDIADTITFRWKAAQLADRIVKELNLPIPSNKSCIMWDPCYWRSSEAADCW
ncbi:hypothetical protein GCG54_00012420 [Colletotrichum gloeosporioides]|uniref:Uncharacterized protein n=1 Tax=Colletotrichum gloeosporioides TaxID=474922 RepID=A0A8H4FIG4_COLGL|nr:uncharacterized protein GCG54_00012420 [Colletotrichum gloeosporioides]KAF3802174.1 hypothetical protein GCG54_00012420 [Colletotrichum gloeosporioides]